MRKSILARVSIGNRTDGRVYISVYFNKKRYRFSNGEPIGVNIFRGNSTPFSHDYFKGLWTKFKKTTYLINEGQTICSFRHSGAIEVFERTKNLHLLSQPMGHGSLVVTLTYLRRLEITTFEVKDLPQLYDQKHF